MIYLPAFFFGFCFFRSIFKYKWNVAAYIYLMYFITGVATVILDQRNLYQYNCLKQPLGIIAPFLYCFLLWVCINPFEKKLGNIKIERLIINNEKILDWATTFFFLMFIVVAYVASTKINDILLNSTFKDVRQDTYNGDAESFYNHLHGIPRYICALSTFFFSSSFFMLVIFFVNVLYRHKKWYVNVMALLGSTVQLISSVVTADRSQFFYWVVMAGLLYTFFQKSITGFEKKRLISYFIPIILIVATYMITVSLSRWGGNDSNDGSMVVYLGQNYINFCNFFNNFWDSPHSLCVLFPLTYYVFGGPQYFQYTIIVENATGIFIQNFSTFLGYICSISGPIVMILYAFLFTYFANKFLKRRHDNQMSFVEVTRFWIVALVPACGFFCYHYSFYSTTIGLIIWTSIANFSNKKIV